MDTMNEFDVPIEEKYMVKVEPTMNGAYEDMKNILQGIHKYPLLTVLPMILLLLSNEGPQGVRVRDSGRCLCCRF